jgi:leader peptidase (prepilin peptidase) / N-methyltransferase
VTAAAPILAAAPGLAIGSFLTVVVARVPARRSVVRPGSACGSCGEPVRWYDNVPVLSYALLRGRCRSCRAPIGGVYPAIELVTAAFFGACAAVFGLTPRAAVAAFFGAVLVAVSFVDLRHRIVPNRIILPCTLVLLAAQTALEPSPEWLMAALSASAFLFVAVLAHPRGMGMGDVKLALFLGAGLGRTVGVALMVGMFAALLPSIVLLVRHGSSARKMGIPFAPFLSIGAIVALFAGDAILDAYLAQF